MSATIKSVQPFIVQRVTFHSKTAIADVLSRIDNELKRPHQPPATALAGTPSREAFERGIREKIGEKGFMFFFCVQHDSWFHLYAPSDTTLVERVYILGNPLIAQTMMRHDLRAGLNVPLRLLVLETDTDGEKGTSILYDLPSSLIAIEKSRAELKEAAEGLDEKLESFVRAMLE